MVVGSSNMDLVVRSPRIPVPGETILGGDFLIVPGGKGANQAVAVARLGAHVCFVTKLGDDAFGRKSLEGFKMEGMDTRHVTVTADAPTGVALITVDAAGNNAIVVAPGANAKLGPEDIYRVQSDICSASAVVVQLEIPMTTVQCVAELAHRAGALLILNPAPAQPLAPELLRTVGVLTPNEIEARMLTGVEVVDPESAAEAAARLLDAGVGEVILTMGEKGLLLADENEMEFIPAYKVEAVDTTAAGDCFTGAFAVSRGQGHDLRNSAIFAARAAALCVMKRGAQPSMPTMQEVCDFVPPRDCPEDN
ncbi:MAG: ribokinase [Sedimentisphaerales bacterium]|nr:ribokinase [Sedimentisphaerales bacterium]